MAQVEPAKAVLIPMNGDQPDTNQDHHIPVQFNPETLRVSLSNTLKADNSGGHSSAAAQYVDKSESTLSVELVFDTTVEPPEDVPPSQQQSHSDNHGAGAGQTTQNPAQKKAYKDVREKTRRIADTFMKPVDPDSDKPGAPKRCHFQWGSFVFTGMVSSYSETLDFFLSRRRAAALHLVADLEAGSLSIRQPSTGPRFTPRSASRGGAARPRSGQPEQSRPWGERC